MATIVEPPPTGRVWQEFYCNECDGYFTLKLNPALNYDVSIVCPNCQHEHHRTIKNGQLYDEGRRVGAEQICPPKSAYSKKPVTHVFETNKKRNGPAPRNGQIIAISDLKSDLEKEAKQNEKRSGLAFVRQLWVEKFGGKE